MLRSCYELATRDSIGHLLIDLDPPYITLFEILFKYHTTWANIFFVYPYLIQKLLQSQMKKKKSSTLFHMVQLKPDHLKRLIRKTSNREIITLICECLLNVVNGNITVKIANIERFETADKYLVTPKTSVFEKCLIFLNKEHLHLVRQIFCFVTSTSQLNYDC